MIEKAKAKTLPSNLVEMKQMDAQNMEFGNDSFDSVVETFALCSYPDPVKVLQEMQRVCKADGTILLFEHGTESEQ